MEKLSLLHLGTEREKLIWYDLLSSFSRTS